jgi:hypothetical protein
MDTKNVAKTEKITLKCHYKRETHVNDTTKNRKNEKIFRIFSLFNFFFFHIFHIFSLVNLPFFQFLVFILTMSFSSAFIFCFARTDSCWFRMFIRKLSVFQVHIVVGSEYSFWPWVLAAHLLSVLQKHIVVGSECLLENCLFCKYI